MRQLGEFLQAGGQFRDINPKRLSGKQFQNVLGLMRQSVVEDYPERSRREISFYMENAALGLANPNSATGGPFLRDKQTFRNRHLNSGTFKR